MKNERNFANQLISLLENKAQIIIVISSLIILFVTLLPFDFSVPYNFSLKYVYHDFLETTNTFDLIVNVILFMPFGFGIAAFLNKKGLRAKSIIVSFLASLSLTSTVEICQLFLASRNSSLSDVITNSFGGFLGAVLFFTLIKNKQQLSQIFSFIAIFDDRHIQFKSLIILWMIYFFSISFLLISVEDRTKLSNWDANFPLMVGNEATGDRSWSGKIAYLCISKSSFSEKQLKTILATNNSCKELENTDDLVTAYSFLDSQKLYPELTGNIATLKEQETRPLVDATGIIVDKKNWLKTNIPASELTRKIKNSSQFTIFTKIATANFIQEGPARIISLSKNQYWRNLTIGQWRKDLSIRMRMPLTGGNGKNPEIRINNFFTDTNFHQIAIAYNGTRLRIYVDEVDKVKSLYLGSEAALFWSVFSIFAGKMYLKPANNSLYIILYHGFMFVPLGFFWGTISNFLKVRSLGLVAFLIGGLIVPPLIIESIIVSTRDRHWNWSYFSLGIAVITISFLLTKLSFDKRQKEIASNK